MDFFLCKLKDLRVHYHLVYYYRFLFVIVITTALIPGRPAPKLISKSMVEKMKKGSVIVDLASENGGNCEATEKDAITNYNGVTIDGSSNLPSEMQLHASQLYAKNISTFINYIVFRFKNSFFHIFLKSNLN